MNGFTDTEILELRKGTATFNSKLDALAKSIVENRGKATNESKKISLLQVIAKLI